MSSQLWRLVTASSPEAGAEGTVGEEGEEGSAGDFDVVGMGIVGCAFLLRLSLDFLAGAELTTGAGPDAVLLGCCRTWRLMRGR